MLFDTVIVVDWSARNTPSPKRPSPDAIWIGIAGVGAREPVYLRTRWEARDWLLVALGDAVSAGRRVLAGFDFPLGYPVGFAQALTGAPSALSVWAWLERAVQDTQRNMNNRFEIAAAINARFPGVGPFWGRPGRLLLDALPDRGSSRRQHDMPERRAVERQVRSAQPVWKLFTTGSVGSQTLTGLPILEHLRNSLELRDHLAVWPLETGFICPKAPLTLAEVYPSLVVGSVDRDQVKDAVQVGVLAERLHDLDRTGALASLFGTPEGLGAKEARDIAREEGWILGAGQIERSAHSEKGLPFSSPDAPALPRGTTWLPVDEALMRLKARLRAVAGSECVPLAAAGGRILAEPLTASRSNPPTANAAVDGYGFAVRKLSPDGRRMPLANGRAAAGAPLGRAVPAGTAVRILTGASLPDGVDTVVLEEDVRLQDGRLILETLPRLGANTRRAGEDLVAGDEALAAGRRLAPQDLALAAAVGADRLVVRRRVRVAIISTGDELVQAGAVARPDQIYDANRPMLVETLRRWGCDIVDLGIVPDERGVLLDRLEHGASSADAVVTSGGASAGDEDHVSASLRVRDPEAVWRIAVKPGRPLAFGLWNGVPLFALPGNPVAAFVCALVFVRPALGLLAGGKWVSPAGIEVPAAFEKDKRPGRREFLRARLTPGGTAEVFASEGSGRISGLSWADGLVDIPHEVQQIRHGDPVRYVPFSAFGI